MNTPPISFVKLQIYNEILNRSTDLIQKAESGEITEREYHVMNFPADAISTIDKAVVRAFDLFNGVK